MNLKLGQEVAAIARLKGLTGEAQEVTKSDVDTAKQVKAGAVAAHGQVAEEAAKKAIQRDKRREADVTTVVEVLSQRRYRPTLAEGADQYSAIHDVVARQAANKAEQRGKRILTPSRIKAIRTAGLVVAIVATAALAVVGATYIAAALSAILLTVGAVYGIKAYRHNRRVAQSAKRYQERKETEANRAKGKMLLQSIPTFVAKRNAKLEKIADQTAKAHAAHKKAAAEAAAKANPTRVARTALRKANEAGYDEALSGVASMFEPAEAKVTRTAETMFSAAKATEQRSYAGQVYDAIASYISSYSA